MYAVYLWMRISKNIKNWCNLKNQHFVARMNTQHESCQKCCGPANKNMIYLHFIHNIIPVIHMNQNTAQAWMIDRYIHLYENINQRKRVGWMHRVKRSLLGIIRVPIHTNILFLYHINVWLRIMRKKGWNIFSVYFGFCLWFLLDPRFLRVAYLHPQQSRDYLL